jgi:hypothetical protein
MAEERTVTEKDRNTLEEAAWKEVERLRTAESDWGLAARCWIKWIEKNSKSWDFFIDRLIENNSSASGIWNSFSSLSNDFECMARDWVAAEEQESYLALCGADTGTAKAMD